MINNWTNNEAHQKFLELDAKRLKGERMSKEDFEQQFGIFFRSIKEFDKDKAVIPKWNFLHVRDFDTLLNRRAKKIYNGIKGANTILEYTEKARRPIWFWKFINWFSPKKTIKQVRGSSEYTEVKYWWQFLTQDTRRACMCQYLGKTFKYYAEGDIKREVEAFAKDINFLANKGMINFGTLMPAALMPVSGTNEMMILFYVYSVYTQKQINEVFGKNIAHREGDQPNKY